ncbi:MAG: PTS sugar transporter subunit IIA [Luteimonas sp.]
MPRSDLLVAERIVMLTEPGDRGQVLDAAARLLSGGLPTLTTSIGNALREREQLISTAIGHGVAIPHARCNAHASARGAFLRLTRPVDFGAGDDIAVDLVFAMSVPEHSAQRHLQALAEIAEHFNDGGFRAALRCARDLPALRKVLLDLPHATMPMSVSAVQMNASR